MITVLHSHTQTCMQANVHKERKRQRKVGRSENARRLIARDTHTICLQRNNNLHRPHVISLTLKYERQNYHSYGIVLLLIFRLKTFSGVAKFK